MEEIVALFSIGLLTGVGWLAARLFFSRIISDENSIYFAPALGAGICALVAYAAVHFYQPWLYGAFCLVVIVVGVLFRKRLHSPALAESESWRLFRFTALIVLALYGMQIALYGLFSRLYPGPHEIWSLFSMTGVSPPDQMFAWHQAMYADQHRHYPQDPFMGEMDLYDRPQLGGYITLFFFKLFQLPLTEDHSVYPPDGLHFYHCLWWLLNNVYLLGIAPLFRKLFGYRGAIIAVATTALGGFFFICAAGGWMKFAGAYPLLLAFLLYLENQGPALQAALCALSYYIHGSMLPFLAGFGLLQIFNLRYAINGRQLRARNVGIFAMTGVVLIGAWFVVVRWAGSKQPLLYYYLYGAGLTEAQTKPVADLAKAFYDKHTWATVSLFPARSLLLSWFPFELLRGWKEWLVQGELFTWRHLADVLFALQRLCVECGLAVSAAPIIISGMFTSLAKEQAGKVGLALYLIPTLLVALFYRIDWAFSLHILIPYHTLCLFLWVTLLNRWSTCAIVLWLSAVALEGLICTLFADLRMLPANALDLSAIPVGLLWWLAGYLLLFCAILAGAAWEVGRSAPAGAGATVPSSRVLQMAGVKVLAGLAIIAAVIGIYSVYCLRFYPR